MDVDKIVKQSLDISNVFDSIATRIFEQAKDYRHQNKITYTEYKQIMDNYYIPLMTYSSKILMDSSIAIINDLDKYMNTLETSVKELKDTAGKIVKTEQTFTLLTYILASAAAVASFAAAPTPATFAAAAASIAGTIDSIKNLKS